MKVSSIANIDHSKHKTIGLVQGISVQSINVFRQFVGDVKGLFGARQKAWEKKFTKAREEAIDDMISKAKELNADEVIAVNIDVSELSGYIVFIADGTAIMSKDKKPSRRSSKRSSKR